MTDHDKKFGKEIGNELLTRFKHNKDVGVEADAVVYLEADVVAILEKAKEVYKQKYKAKYKPSVKGPKKKAKKEATVKA